MTTKQKYIWGAVIVAVILIIIYRKEIGSMLGFNGDASGGKQMRCCDAADYAAYDNCAKTGGSNCDKTWLGGCEGASSTGRCKGRQTYRAAVIVNKPNPANPDGGPKPTPVA